MDGRSSILATLLSPAGVVDLAPGDDKRSAIDRLGRLCCEAAAVPPEDVPSVLAALYEREQVVSTGIGLGIAVPHVRHASASSAVLRVGRSKAGIPFDSIDGQPVHVMFAILMPSGQHRRHVEVLGAIARALKDPARRASVFAAPDSVAFVARMLAP